MMGYMGQKVDGLSYRPAAVPGPLVSLELARADAAGNYPKKDITIPFPFVTNETVKSARTCSPTCPTASSPFTDCGPHAIVKSASRPR